nr:hypothetical protein [Tanacetum cinerariifolium]
MESNTKWQWSCFCHNRYKWHDQSFPPKTAEEVVARERERKARTTLLIALLEDHLEKFHKMVDAKEMWEAIKSRFGGNDDSKARDNGRRPAFQDDSKALVTIDGEDIDWFGHVEEDTQNYAMMAFSSSNLGSDNKIKSCSKTCEESYAKLKKLYDEQKDKLGDASDDLHRALKDKGIVNSGSSRHITANKAHLADYQEFKGGSVAFGGSNGKITGKGKIKAGSAGTQANDDQGANSENLIFMKNILYCLYGMLTQLLTPISTAGPSRALNNDEPSYPDDPSMPHLEDIYASLSKGIFTDSSYDNEGVVYKVVKALYGLHQAPRAWYSTLSTFLERSGYRRGAIDKTLFIKQDKKDIMLVQVKQKEDGIFISQDKYVAKILKNFDFLNVKTASTPIKTQKPLVKDKEAADVDVHLYRSMIGSLMYLTASRPDIMFAVGACSRFQVTPKTLHLQAVKRIFRYLKGQPELGLLYPKVSTFNLEACSDSDYAGANLDRKSTTGDSYYAGANLDRKSTIGGCQFLGRRLVLWQCKKQTIMATSTIKVEYVAAAHC